MRKIAFFSALILLLTLATPSYARGGWGVAAVAGAVVAAGMAAAGDGMVAAAAAVCSLGSAGMGTGTAAIPTTPMLMRRTPIRPTHTIRRTRTTPVIPPPIPALQARSHPARRSRSTPRRYGRYRQNSSGLATTSGLLTVCLGPGQGLPSANTSSRTAYPSMGRRLALYWITCGRIRRAEPIVPRRVVERALATLRSRVWLRLLRVDEKV
jgi:hypothetical protein